MIQTLGMSMVAALLVAFATVSAYAQSKGTDLRPWTFTDGDNATFQKKPGALKAKNPKAKVSGEVFVRLPRGGRHSKDGTNLKTKD